jgi:hypothetical protein
MTLGTAGLEAFASTPNHLAREGWRLLRTQKNSNESALTAMNDRPTDAIAVPPNRRYASVMGLAAASSKALTVDVYGWPNDPGTDTTTAEKNDSDGEGCGVLLSTLTLTSIARQATSVETAATTGQYQTNHEAVDTIGMAWIAARITNVASSAAEIVCRFY